jgi:hypothetical protein
MEWFKDEIFLNSFKDEISEMTPKLMCKSQNIFADKATTGYLSTISYTDTRIICTKNVHAWHRLTCLEQPLITCKMHI